jgi:CRISPR/Cas system-associated exonuclease Cas4 (RecB family)
MRKTVTPGGFEARAVGEKTKEQLQVRRDTYLRDVGAAKKALLRQLADGTDIGEFVLEVMLAAQREVTPGYSLLDNRPGSWESSALETLMNNVEAVLMQERAERRRAEREKGQTQDRTHNSAQETK